MVINGVLAGLVAITAGCNLVSPLSAIIIGLISGVIVEEAVQIVDQRRVDDPVGAIAVHGFNGVFGTLAVGLFAKEKGLLMGGGPHLLSVQAIGVFVIATFSFVTIYVVMTILKKTMGVRVSREEELSGIDAGSFGVESYSTFE